MLPLGNYVLGDFYSLDEVMLLICGPLKLRNGLFYNRYSAHVNPKYYTGGGHGASKASIWRFMDALQANLDQQIPLSGGETFLAFGACLWD